MIVDTDSLLAGVWRVYNSLQCNEASIRRSVVPYLQSLSNALPSGAVCSSDSQSLYNVWFAGIGVTMNATTRLDGVRSKLEQDGVLDVKFFFAKGVSDNSCAEVANQVAIFLDAYQAGNFRRVESFADRP